MRSPEPFYHQCLGWFLILINPKLRKKAAIALWKRVFKKSFCNLPPTLKTPWLRWWDNRGNLLLTGNERAEDECRGFYHPHHR
ncbi:hypothetical protein [Cylindrospermopsis raciborskii]|uniref:hypothetical protein n=1 Tax=Cylindrospermopsis raciborskii TaxID=77022 RepID=UPI0011787970|nr:hypothetical protein [Cylindrospermopsis raciborskii]